MTITPNPGFRDLHRLLGRLRHPACSSPTVRSLALQLSWTGVALDDDSVAVKPKDDPPGASARGHIHADGSFEKAQHCDGETVIALRNLAADPGRRFRRFGQETCACPFCGTHLGFGELASVIGYCAACSCRLGWQHDERAAEQAEDALRRDILREMDDPSQFDADGCS